VKARKLRYRLQEERTAVVERLREALGAWQQAWALEGAALTHRLLPVEASMDDGARSPWQTLGRDEEGAVAAFYRIQPIEHPAGSLGTGEYALAHRWLGLPAPGVQARELDLPPLGARLAQLAHDALLRAAAELTGCAAVQSLPAGDAPRPCTRPFSGALRICTSGAGATLEWLLPAGTVDRLAPPRPAPNARARVPLETVAQALSQYTLTVGVEIDPVTLSLGELAGLHAGDVITLGHRLDAPLSVVDDAGHALFGGFLVASDGRKSLKLHADTPR
jgi:hypothetical protein